MHWICRSEGCLVPYRPLETTSKVISILLSSSYSQLRDTLGIYTEEAEKLDLHLGWTKTKFMYVGDGPDPLPLQLGNNSLKRTLSIRAPQRQQDLKPVILRRRTLAESALRCLWKELWWHQVISCKTEFHIYNSAVLSILLYA